MKPAIAIAVLAAAGVASAQDQPTEQRIAALIDELDGDLPDNWSGG